MAMKVLTAIGKVIEGKTISVTICHECHEVSNHYFCSIRSYVFEFVYIKATEVEEPFFDISLPIPGEGTFKKVCIYVHSYIINMMLELHSYD